ncbi:MAG: M48 family metalloprotease [Lysobacter sp.]|nr:M48 family metalloprotease [Lysobacter sp.]
MGSISQYRSLVARLEQDARTSPRAYRMRVALLAMLGFGFLATTLVLALGVSVGLIVALIAVNPLLLLKLVKIVWIPLVLGWMILKALWIRFSPPDGRLLQPGEAPALQAEIERIRLAAGAPALHGIYLDGELNAAACTVPRVLGLLGHRHYLVLGIPLMQALDRDQFAAVVAHEFGHFGGQHGRFTGWIYHVRMSWYRLLEALRVQGSWFSRLFTRFFEWYAPYFNAYSFALARQQEFEADAIAARVAGSNAIGTALVQTSSASAVLQSNFWPDLDRAMRAGEQPPSAVYRDMAMFLQAPHPARDAHIQHALQLQTGIDDTHPSLSVRLAALGVNEVTLQANGTSAAQALLGDLLPQIEAEFSAQWHEFAAPMWKETRERIETGTTRLQELEAQDARTPDEAVEYASLIDDLRTPREAIDAMRTALVAKPDDNFVRARLGMLLLDENDAEGVALLREAMAREPESREALLPFIDAFYVRTGADDAVRDQLAAELRKHQRASEAIDRIRNTVDGKNLLPHGLDEATIATLREALDLHGKIKKAWLVRRDLGADASVPHFVLLLTWRGFFISSEEKELGRLVEALELPGTFIACTPGNRRAVASRIRKACGKPTYHRR